MNRLASFAAIVASFVLASARGQESNTPAHEHEATERPQSAVENAHSFATSRDAATGDASSAIDHVPPPPPLQAMAAMSGHDMTNAMEMDDAAPLATLRFDRLERADGDGVATAWKFSASVGGDFDKLLVRSEGERSDGGFERSGAEALWSHAVASYWDTQVGVRRDFGRGVNRAWAAFGLQGLAPYGVEVGATAYVGDSGRTALRLEVDYDLSLTQRLILQPRIELNAYSKSDPAAFVGSGSSDAEIGLRLRYEIRRDLAPYVGVERSWLIGDASGFARGGCRDAADTRWVVGLRLWY